jgi:hypothetical protein
VAKFVAHLFVMAACQGKLPGFESRHAYKIINGQN